MLGSHRLGAIIEVRHLATMLHGGCVCTVRWPSVLLFHVSDYIINTEYIDDRKFIVVYVCQKLS